MKTKVEPFGARSRSHFALFALMALGLSLIAANKGLAVAGLKFEALTETAQADLSVRYEYFTFECVNVADYPIKIIEAQPSCSCAEFVISKSQLGPGEKGSVTVKIDISGKSGGEAVVTLVLVTDEKDQKYFLTSKILVPAGFSVQPRMLVWRKGTEKTSKHVRISVGANSGLKLSGVEIAGGGFSAHLLTAVPGREWSLDVAPITVEAPAYARIHLISNGTLSDPDECYIYARVAD
jgi:hypothetical protein